MATSKLSRDAAARRDAMCAATTQKLCGIRDWSRHRRLAHGLVRDAGRFPTRRRKQRMADNFLARERTFHDAILALAVLVIVAGVIGIIATLVGR